MIPTGPSPFMNGIFESSSSAFIIIGRQNANVLPEPVNAIPIMSRPAKLWNIVSHTLQARRTSILTL